MNTAGKGRPGLASVTFRQLSPREIVAAAKDAGLQVLEWGGDVHVPAGDIKRARDVAGLTRDAGLETISYGSYYRAGHEGEGGKPPFSVALETAVALGAPCIRVWAGTRGSDFSDDAYFAQVCDDASRIADEAQKSGVRVAFEFHDGTLHDTPAAAERFLAELPHPNIYSLWQPLVSLDAEQRLRSLQAVLPRLSHVHVFHWLPGDPVDRRPLAEGAKVWQDWFETMHLAGHCPDALLEFVHGDQLVNLASDAWQLQALLRSSGMP